MKHINPGYYLILIGLFWNAFAFAQTDTTRNLPYPIKDTRNPLNNPKNPFSIQSKTEKKVTYDPKTGKYVLTETLNGINVKPPVYMTFEEYLAYEKQKNKSQYWQERAATGTGDAIEKKGIIPPIKLPKKTELLFGSNTIDIRPQGSAELIFAGNFIRNENPALNVQQRRIGNFDFDLNIQMSVVGNIGDKLQFKAVQNTQAVFEFDNTMKLGYQGKEDEIIKNIEAGNVTLPLRSSLIQGSQSLFGLKTELQFGRLRVTTVISQQKGVPRQIQAQGGAQFTEFEIPVDQYDGDRHFFLSQAFRNQYNQALENYPVVRSGVNITRVEVWVTPPFGQTSFALQQNPDVRDVIGFLDMATPGQYIYDQSGTIVQNNNSAFPSNDVNSLYQQLLANPSVRLNNQAIQELQTGQFMNLQETRDYEKTFAKRLKPSEYSFHPQLGYISLKAPLQNGQVLAVSYEYTLNGRLYRVGEFSQEVPSDQNNPTVLFLKLLRGTTTRTDLPTWDLMMRNIYSLNAFEISQQDFVLNIIYEDVTNGIKPFIPEGSIAGQQLIRVLGVDRLNVQQEPVPDGFFDFVPGITMDIQNGKIVFPVLEPFGDDLRAKFVNPGTGMPDPKEIADKYVYDPLYDSTRAWAQQFPNLNRFKLIGRYQGKSSNEIYLNALNIPPGSVSVRAGNRVLQENVDYRVDYVLGKVTIVNPGVLQSGEPITVGFENNPLFQQQQRNTIAARFDYEAGKDLNLGGTVLRMTERPILAKVDQGTEPISNTIIGIDGSYTTKSGFLTRAIDKLPFLETKEESNITLNAEYAHLFPGNARAIAQDGGISYIDDFEGSENSIDMRLPGAWFISTTPQLFTEADVTVNDLDYNKNRAKLSWYYIDQLFLRNSGITPDHIQNNREMKSLPYMREVLQSEVFPNRQLANTTPPNIQTLDLAYYPSERGPYNYNAQNTDADGFFTNPRNRWAGITRRVQTNDFEAANIEFVEFWVMDPFLNDDYTRNTNHRGGDLYLNLGVISEDVLKDDRRSFENGLPRTDDPNQVDTTAWGVVSRLQPITNAFDNDPEARRKQDVGLDGLDSDKERNFFKFFLDSIAALHGTNSRAYQAANLDPSSDDYHHFRGTDYDNQELDILQRYKLFNGLEGNSPTDQDSPEDYPTQATSIPNNEDINLDNRVRGSNTDAYYEYRISMRQNADGVIQSKYVVDSLSAPVVLPNGQTQQVRWYQFRVPVQKPDNRYGDVIDYKSIQFMRLFMTGFEQPTVLRFATLQLVRTDWRRYLNNLQTPGEYEPTETDETEFLVSTVNIEENGNRQPINYVIPPGIQRQTNAFATNFQQLNEQSLQLKFCNLKDGDSRAAFKTAGFDVRAYKKLKMFVHLEGDNLQNGDVHAFIRFGADFVDNYYEYQIPLNPSEYNNNDEEAIWPFENRVEFALEQLREIKKMRNSANWDLTQIYEIFTEAGHKISIKGNPIMSNIQVVMLGVRNPKAGTGQQADDDAQPKCGEVWFNELRLAEFDNRSGYAATGSAIIQLANLGTVNFASTFTSIGFGGVESRVAERSREKTFQYDLASNLSLGRFFPEKWGVQIPMYIGQSEIFVTPEFDPLNPDVLLETSLSDASDQAARDSILSSARSYTRRRSLNFTNVQKQRTKGKKGKPFPWDISNFAFNYAFTETFMQDPFTQSNSDKRWRGGINYNYSPNLKPIEPFKWVKPKFLGFIKEINFNLVPNSFTFRTDFERVYHRIELRNNSFGGISLPATVFKNFTLNRFYTLQWNLTRSLKLDYNSSINTRIDEPIEPIEEIGRTAYREAVWQGIRDSLGRPTQFNQAINLNYNLPFSKFRILNWINGSVRYGTTYDWQGARLAAIELQHTIQNSQAINGQLQFNFSTLYNKSEFLKKISTGKPLFDEEKRAERKGEKPEKEKRKDQFGDDFEGKKTKKDKEGKEEDPNKQSFGELAIRTVGNLVMGIKNVGFTYGENNGTLIPGFNQTPQYLGNNWGNNAPGWDFILGKQFNSGNINEFNEFQRRIIANNWLTLDTNLFALSQVTNSRNFSGRASIEPFRDFRIELNMTYNESSQLSTNFRANTDGFIQSFNPLESGSYTISIISWRTAFDKVNSDEESPLYLSSETFRNFERSRLEMANRLANNDNYDENDLRESRDSISVRQGYPRGYSRKSLDVLIPAFYAAYTGKNVSDVPTGFRPLKIPLPNWRITYTGLSRMKWARNIFRSLTLNHAYRSTYTVGNFITNLVFQDNISNGLVPQDTSLTGDLYPEYQIAQVTIAEQLSPLIGLDMTLKNGITTRIEFKKTRTLNLSLVNNRLTEMTNKEFTIGLGYRIEKPKIWFLFNGKPLKNDLNFRFDFSFRDNRTLLRDLDGQTTQATAGMKTISIRPNVSYVLNNKVTFRLFYDRQMNTPYISTSFPNSNTRVGLSIRFTLAQ